MITSGDCVYKMDYNKVLEYHIAKKADITVVCKDIGPDANAERYGILKMNEESRIEEFDEKPVVSSANTISCGIYVVRRRQLIEMIEKCAQEDRYDFVKDILIRYKNLKGSTVIRYMIIGVTLQPWTIILTQTWISLRPRQGIISLSSILTFTQRLMICLRPSITWAHISKTA